MSRFRMPWGGSTRICTPFASKTVRGGPRPSSEYQSPRKTRTSCRAGGFGWWITWAKPARAPGTSMTLAMTGARLLETLADPADPEHAEMVAWVGGPFDPKAFDPREVRFDNPKERWEIAFGGPA